MREREQRLFEAKRAGVVARIGDSGIGRDRAQALFDGFDRAATSGGVARGSQAYWEEAERWIAMASQGPMR